MALARPLTRSPNPARRTPRVPAVWKTEAPEKSTRRRKTALEGPPAGGALPLPPTSPYRDPPPAPPPTRSSREEAEVGAPHTFLCTTLFSLNLSP